MKKILIILLFLFMSPAYAAYDISFNEIGFVPRVESLVCNDLANAMNGYLLGLLGKPPKNFVCPGTALGVGDMIIIDGSPPVTAFYSYTIKTIIEVVSPPEPPPTPVAVCVPSSRTILPCPSGFAPTDPALAEPYPSFFDQLAIQDIAVALGYVVIFFMGFSVGGRTFNV